MPFYRKTALVFAEQYLTSKELPKGVEMGVIPSKPYIMTLEGKHYVRNGDYICTGPAGEQWNVEQSIFENTYEEVNE